MHIDTQIAGLDGLLTYLESEIQAAAPSVPANLVAMQDLCNAIKRNLQWQQTHETPLRLFARVLAMALEAKAVPALTAALQRFAANLEKANKSAAVQEVREQFPDSEITKLGDDA